MLKLALLSIIVFCSTVLVGQESGRMFSFKVVGWNLVLSDKFELVSAEENAIRMERGAKAIEDMNDIKVDASTTRTLISATKETYNYFNATITPFDTATDGSYETANQSVKDLVYKTMAAKMPNEQIDSSSANHIIDGLLFNKFTIYVKTEKVSFGMVLLTKLYRGFDFGISYVYLNDETRKEIEEMLAGSRFDK